MAMFERPLRGARWHGSSAARWSACCDLAAGTVLAEMCTEPNSWSMRTAHGFSGVHTAASTMNALALGESFRGWGVGCCHRLRCLWTYFVPRTMRFDSSTSIYAAHMLWKLAMRRVRWTACVLHTM